MQINRDLLPARSVIAAKEIGGHIRETPLDYSPYFSELTGASVWMKLENLQHTGSFKLRGAFNKLLSLPEAERARGCVAASSGNHGAAVAHAMRSLDVRGIVFVPEQTSSTKVDAIKRAGAEIEFFGTDGLDTEVHAREYAKENGMAYLSPYNDADVIAGQGTCGVEIASQLPDVEAVFVAVGGGGLISGVGAFLKSVNPSLQVVACQPAASVPQIRSASISLTVEQMVTLGRFPYLSAWQFRPSAQDLERVDRALETVGLGALRDRRMDELSGGERQSVFIAAALAQEAEILLLDEPTTHLDARHQLEVIHLLRELRRSGEHAIVLTTHDLNLALRLADRVLALKEGQVVAAGDPEQLLAPGKLEQIFDAPFAVLREERAVLPSSADGARHNQA